MGFHNITYLPKYFLTLFAANDSYFLFFLMEMLLCAQELYQSLYINSIQINIVKKTVAKMHLIN